MHTLAVSVKAIVRVVLCSYVDPTCSTMFTSFPVPTIVVFQCCASRVACVAMMGNTPFRFCPHEHTHTHTHA